MDSLETVRDFRGLVQDLYQLAGVDRDRNPWFKDEGASAELNQNSDFRELVSSLLIRLIGMEVPLS